VEQIAAPLGLVSMVYSLLMLVGCGGGGGGRQGGNSMILDQDSQLIREAYTVAAKSVAGQLVTHMRGE